MINRIFHVLINYVGKLLLFFIYAYGAILVIFLLVNIGGFIFYSVKEHTYICTDLSFYNVNMTNKEIQKYKNDALGSICVLDFYDNNVKITIPEKNGKKDSGVLDKVTDSKYQFTEQSGYQNGQPLYKKAVIELQYFLDTDFLSLHSNISSFTMYIYENDELKTMATFKRK